MTARSGDDHPEWEVEQLTLDDRCLVSKILGAAKLPLIQLLTDSATFVPAYSLTTNECSNSKCSPVSITLVNPQYLQVTRISPGLMERGPPQ